MTAHPMDTEALTERLRDYLIEQFAQQDPRPEFATVKSVKIAGLVAPFIAAEVQAAEHRATRAEAQSEARRIDIEYWQGVARGNAIAADVWKESAEEAEARIKAVRDVLEEQEARGPVGMTFNGTPFPAWISIATIRAALDS